jgi:hypothetical protein
MTDPCQSLAKDTAREVISQFGAAVDRASIIMIILSIGAIILFKFYERKLKKK